MANQNADGENLASWLGRAVRTCLACGLLGAFSGCNADVFSAELGRRPGAFPWLAGSGILLGLFFAARGGGEGLSGALWPRRLRGDTAQAGRLLVLYGAGCLAAAVWACDSGRLVVRAYGLRPVAAPLKFDAAGNASAQVSLTAQASLPYAVRLKTREYKPAVIPQVFMEVEDEGGATQSTPDTGYDVGRFEAREGRRYRVTVRVSKASRAFRSLEPEVRVGTRQAIHFSYVTGCILFCHGLAAGAAGLILSGWGAARLAAESRAQRAVRR